MRGSRFQVALVLAGAPGVGLLAQTGRGEIYTWTDAEGKSHFTQDLQSVPADQRGAARERASQTDAPRKVQTYSSAPAAPAPNAARRAAVRPTGGAGGGGRVHRIPVERAGTGMIVP